MKIAIDISPILYGTGVSVYTKELVENLLRLDSKNSYLLFGGSLRRRSEFNKFAASFKGNFETKFLPIAPTVADFVWNSLHVVSVEKIISNEEGRNLVEEGHAVMFSSLDVDYLAEAPRGAWPTGFPPLYASEMGQSFGNNAIAFPYRYWMTTLESLSFLLLVLHRFLGAP